MGYVDYISESEAAAMSGVSGATLRRFAEAGYLKLEADADGLRLFSKSELKNVFGLGSFDSSTCGVRTVSTRRQNTASPEILRETVTLKPQPPVRPAGQDALKAEAANPVFSRESRPLASRIEVICTEPPETGAKTLKETPLITVTKEETIDPSASRIATSQGSGAPGAALIDSFVKLEPRPDPALDQIASLKMEVTRVKQVSDMQDKLLSIKDTQIAELKSQNEWLKERVEKLEQKAERDQLLLLAETQTVKTLISSGARNSPVRQALEWLGFLNPQQANQSHTIEIAQKT